MGTIKVGRETKREYHAVRYFAASEQPETEQADGQVQQPAEQPDGETAQARQEPAETPEQAKEQTPKEKKMPVAKQSRKKGGKR